jgi:hypothetical protein
MFCFIFNFFFFSGEKDKKNEVEKEDNRKDVELIVKKRKRNIIEYGMKCKIHTLFILSNPTNFINDFIFSNNIINNSTAISSFSSSANEINEKPSFKMSCSELAGFFFFNFYFLFIY